MLDPPVHSRQFVLGPRPIMPKADWLSRRLEDGLVLSHCPRLKVASVVDRRNRQWLLLGFAVQVDPNRPSPEEDLRNSSAKDISKVYESWAGRWLLIGGGSIHLDAGGLLGCYYRLASDDTGRQRLWVSSSLALLANLSGLESLPRNPRRLTLGHGFSWDPPPRTCYDRIRKVLPTQTLDAASGATRLRPMELRARYALTYDQVLDDLATCLTTAMKNVQGRICLALSAGHDSRLLLSAAQAAGISFNTYTQTTPAMRVADREVPPQLSKLAGIEHVFIHPTRKEQALLDVFDAHCGGQNVDADRTFFARKQWNWIRQGDVMVRGLCFEVATCFYCGRLPCAPLSVEALLHAFGAAKSPEYVRDSVADCMEWIKDTPVEGLDWRDRFYLEARLGGWASAIEQSLDIVEGTSFQPANSARIYDLLFAVPPDKRYTRQHNVDLIRRLSPELLQYPFNEPDGFLRLTNRRLRKYGTLLRELGLATTISQVSSAIGARLTRGRRLR